MFARPSILGGFDLDADGRCDLAISGRGLGFDNVLSFDVRELGGGSQIGSWVWNPVPTGADGERGTLEVVGDLDGDGWNDLAVVDGAAVVLSGRDFSTLRLHQRPAHLTDYAGRNFQPGDVDGDGLPEYVLRWHDAAVGSRFAVFSLGAVQPLLQFDVPGITLDVAGVGDQDGDGVGDFALLQGSAVGGATELSIRSGRDGAGLVRPVVAGPMSQLTDILSLDFNGDGVLDLAWVLQPVRFDLGPLDVVFVSAGPGYTIPVVVRSGSEVGGGRRVLVDVGDTDGDGFDELAVAYADLTVPRSSPPGFLEVLDVGLVGAPPQVARHGAPCRGSNGHLPRIDIQGRPALGEAPTLRLRGGPVSASVFLQLGRPIDAPLDGIGMPGCSAFSSGDGFVLPLVSDARGLAGLGLPPIPQDASLVGAVLSGQWLCLDPAANAVGATASDALRLRFGQ